MFALEGRDLGADQRLGRRLARHRAHVHGPVVGPLRTQAFFPVLTVLPYPVEDRPVTDPHFPGYQVGRRTLFQI